MSSLPTPSDLEDLVNLGALLFPFLVTAGPDLVHANQHDSNCQRSKAQNHRRPPVSFDQTPETRSDWNHDCFQKVGEVLDGIESSARSPRHYKN
jgi:hypothetical protein